MELWDLSASLESGEFDTWCGGSNRRTRPFELCARNKVPEVGHMRRTNLVTQGHFAAV